jgi:hypothetical protein
MILAASVFAIVYGFITRGAFTLAYVFNTCLLLGAIITGAALVVMFLPVPLKPGKLIDHTTIGQTYVEQREQKQKKAYEYLFLGILIIVITGLIQLALAVLLPAN